MSSIKRKLSKYLVGNSGTYDCIIEIVDYLIRNAIRAGVNMNFETVSRMS